MLTILTGMIADAPANELFEPGRRLSLPVHVEGRLGRLVVSVQGFEEEPAPAADRRTRKLTARELERACDAVKARHAGAVRLSEIAGVIGLSPCHFSRAFRASAGMTLTSYVLRVRLEAAMRLMADTDDSLCDIALACGFGDQSNFSRMFVRSHGITPSKWRLCHERTRARHGAYEALAAVG